MDLEALLGVHDDGERRRHINGLDLVDQLIFFELFDQLDERRRTEVA